MCGCPAVQEGLVLQLPCLLALPAGHNLLLASLLIFLYGADRGSCMFRKQPGMMVMD
jgi:hypothetical protein